MLDLSFEHNLLSCSQHLNHRATTTTLQPSCTDSTTSNTKLMPLRDCNESVQASFINYGGSVVKALRYKYDFHVFNSEHLLHWLCEQDSSAHLKPVNAVMSHVNVLYYEYVSFSHLL